LSQVVLTIIDATPDVAVEVTYQVSENIITVENSVSTVNLEVVDNDQTNLLTIEDATPVVEIQVEEQLLKDKVNIEVFESGSEIVLNIGGDGASGGAASTADSLTTPRLISLNGDVTGSTSFDGSGDVTITATVADNSHFLSTANISDISAIGKADGALLQYSSISEKYEPKTSLVNSNLTITGGSF
jgi:hypothetical protein